MLDINISLLFCKMTVFFIKKKRDHLKEQGIDFTPFNYFVIASAIILIALNIFKEVLKCFVYVL